jgi:predicted transglutaminase-like cysteine proteinase
MAVFACRPVLAGLFLSAALVFVSGAKAGTDGLSMQVSGSTGAPVGYIDFCQHFPDQCVVHGTNAPENLTEKTWRDLQEVNTLVNRLITPATDEEIYHRPEVWTLPKTYGDCEDYVLLKRKWLVDRGWPTGALLVTVVFDEVGDGHAVLLARTTHGDFILDNKTDALHRWYETAYRFVKRQSDSDPNRWVSLGDPRWNMPATAASR